MLELGTGLNQGGRQKPRRVRRPSDGPSVSGILHVEMVHTGAALRGRAAVPTSRVLTAGRGLCAWCAAFLWVLLKAAAKTRLEVQEITEDTSGRDSGGGWGCSDAGLTPEDKKKGRTLGFESQMTVQFSESFSSVTRVFRPQHPVTGAHVS